MGFRLLFIIVQKLQTVDEPESLCYNYKDYF